MTYEEIKPSPALTPFVKCFWILENEAVAENPRELVLPDGCMELIIHYGDLFRQYQPGTSASAVQPRSFLYGQLKKFIEVGPTGKTGIISARFHPNGTEPFLSVPAQRLTDKITTLDTLFGEKGKKAEQEIIAADSIAKKISILENLLVSQIRPDFQADAVVENCVQRILQYNGLLNIESLDGIYPFSFRQLERKFTAVVGLTPKMFARIVRFRHIFRLANEQNIDTLATLAYESGYYDQSHFIRDFRAFSGLNPKHYFNAAHPLSDFFTGGK
jgi:AraC-like DNA-binding protein